MKNIWTLAFLLAQGCFADDTFCRKLYNDIINALDPQLTELCATNFDGHFAYKFFLRDDKGFHNMMLVASETDFHLYMEGDENPFQCDKASVIQKTQSPEEIARILFIPRRDCSPMFKNSIGIKWN